MTDIELEIAIAQENERLRQERETFDLEKKHYEQWFQVRRTMGWIVALMLPAVLIVATIIIFNSSDFDRLTVQLATGALLVDTLGAVLALYKLILGSSPTVHLQPVTGHRPIPNRTNQRPAVSRAKASKQVDSGPPDSEVTSQRSDAPADAEVEEMQPRQS